MSDEPHPYQEGKRAGIHPLIVVFVVLIGLWLFVFFIVPSSKNKQATGTEEPAPDRSPKILKRRRYFLKLGRRLRHRMPMGLFGSSRSNRQSSCRTLEAV